MPKIFVLILNYQRYQDTIRCVQALQKSDLPSNSKILIIDNSNDNQSQNILTTKFPKIKFIKSPYNHGFANGNNQGIRLAIKNQATHILIINPDVIVPKKFIKPLLKVFHNHPEAGLVAPVHQHRQNGQTFLGLGGKINWKTSKSEQINRPNITLTQAKKYPFISFACVLIKTEVFQEIGLLNELYFMYLEDVDYCLTAGKSGFTSYIQPQVIIKHFTSSSFSKPTQKLKISYFSQLKFIHRWLKFPITIYAYFYMTIFYIYLYFLWTYHYYKNKQK